MAYTHLSSEDRFYIETRHKLKESTSTIALALGRSQSTISRELRRNRSLRGYRHKLAHDKAQQRHVDKPKARKLTPERLETIEGLLNEQWSPEQISCRLKAEGKVTLCHETIYQHVLKDKREGGVLHMNTLPKPWRVKPILPSPTIRGSAGKMRTPMACYANTSPRRWDCWT